MRKKNLKVNMMIYAVKSILSVLFPLITFPYISRVLQVDNIGKYTFANSIIGYFSLIAGLGVTTYITREGAKVRDNLEQLCSLASEVFTINLISTLVSYVLLATCVLSLNKLQEYKLILTIMSLVILFMTIGKEWIYIIFEDYLYLSIRHIAVQIVSLVLMLFFVKDTEDLLHYVWIHVIASSGANIWSYFDTKRYCSVKIAVSKSILKHVKPIFVFFASTLAVTIYVNSDITMLGLMCSDRSVGIYSTSVKIYNILKSIMIAMVSVTIPRFSSLVGQGKAASKEYESTATETLFLLLTILLPILVGIWLTAEDIIMLIAGAEFIEAVSSLKILVCALICCIIGYFWGDGILISNSREDIVLKGTVIAAIVNVSLNCFFIPNWAEKGAALTTVISEMISAITFFWFGRKYVQISGIAKQILIISLGCGGIAVVGVVIQAWLDALMLRFILTVFSCVITYYIIELLLQNTVVTSLSKNIVYKIKHIKGN